MLSSVLQSKDAINVNVEIMRTFVKLRHVFLEEDSLAERVSKLELDSDEMKKIFKFVFDTNDYGYYFFFLAAIRCHRTKYIKPITACKFNPPIWYRSLWSGYAVNDNGGSPNINCCSFCRGWDWGALWCPTMTIRRKLEGRFHRRWHNAI